MLFFKRQSDTHVLQASNSAPVHHAEGYLEGQLLISTPQLTDSPFEQSVIFLFAHHEHGAMGVIINQPMEEISYGDLVSAEQGLFVGGDQDVTVYYGGPVDRSRGFVVHSNDYQNDDVVFSDGGISLSTNTEILKAIVQGHGPKQHLLAVGYAGWGAGQLEKEIADNSWITVPATAELVFGMANEHKWGMASQSLGIDMAFFSPIAGHA